MLLIVAVELVVLIAYRYRTGRGVPIVPLLVNTGAGGSLMLALGATLKGMSYPVIASCLIGSLIFHVADITLRWRR
jgi:hypothetical protein